MMRKVVTVNTLGRENKKNEAKMHLSHQAHCQKGENDHFSFILSFNLTKNGMKMP